MLSSSNIELLANRIERGQNDKATSMLDEDLLKVSYQGGTWLHYAAARGNEAITRRLIQMGLHVDSLNHDLQTPLMIAIRECKISTINALLQANASIDITDANGKTALQLLFASDMFVHGLFEPFVQRFQRDFSTNDDDEFIDKLFESGCTICHAVFLNNVRDVMTGLLKRGVHIDSSSTCGKTALHAAVLLNDVNLAEWLLKNNADVEACGGRTPSPLYYATIRGKVDFVRLFLENGANPNVSFLGFTPLYQVFNKSRHSYSSVKYKEENWNDCCELLLRYGAIPRNPINKPDSLGFLDLALIHKSFTKMYYLIGQLAMLDKLGMSISESVMRSRFIEEFRSDFGDIRRHYEKCREILEFKCDALSLFDFLFASDDQIRVYGRKQALIRRFEEFCSELSESSYLYYAKTLRRRISKAVDLVKLEEAAILAISKIFDGNFYQCYDFGRKIIEYLSVKDLEQLVQI